MNNPAHKEDGQNCTQTVRFHSFFFNGKEKDYESGFHYYGARYYWSEVLTGWLSVDPMMDKYPGFSPYNYCTWNPVKLVDPDGRDLDIPDKSNENHDRTKHDILNLVDKKNRDRVVFNDNGSVSINTEGLSDYKLSRDKGLALLNDMVKSEKKFFYETSDDYSSVMDDGLQHLMLELQHGVVNASNNGLDSDNGHTHKPKSGYDGHVILAKSGSWKTTDGKDLKSSLLFHEMAENYYRTHDGLNYKPAHKKAIEREGFHYKNMTPGRFYGNVRYSYKGVGSPRWCQER